MTPLHIVPQQAAGPGAERRPKPHRRDKRISVPPIRVAIDGEAFPTVNWSLGGVLVACDARGLGAGEVVPVTGLGPAEGRMLAVSVAARVVRAEGGFLSLEFLELDARAYAVLEALMMRRGPVWAEAVAA
jgi:hypothetical protein